MIARLRELSFDSDGVARFPDGRREGLRLVNGVAGRPGASYRAVLLETIVDPATFEQSTRPADPVDVTRRTRASLRLPHLDDRGWPASSPP